MIDVVRKLRQLLSLEQKRWLAFTLCSLINESPSIHSRNIYHTYFQLMSTSDQVYACHWYEYPVRLQPFVANMVQQMQRPHYMSGMGIVNCSLKSFTSVSSSSVRRTCPATYLILLSFRMCPLISCRADKRRRHKNHQQLLNFVGTMIAVLQSMK